MLENLPVELLLEIYSYLSPEDIIHAGVNKKVRSRITNNSNEANIFWGNKFKIHFPDHYEIFKKKYGDDTNWYLSFKKTYDIEYATLETKVRKLFSLVKEGDIRSLIESNITVADLDKCDKNGDSLLEWAMQINNQAVLNYFFEIVLNNYLISNTVLDALKTDSKKRTILHWAVLCNQHVDIFKLILSHGAAINNMTTGGNTALHLAAQAGQTEIAEYLIKNGANINDRSRAGATSLMFAIENNNKPLVDMLLKYNANANIPLKYDSEYHKLCKIRAGDTPLHAAIKLGHINLVRALLDKGAKINVRNNFGLAPLSLAAQKGFADIVELLIERGANINARSTNGATALLLAVEKNRKEVIQVLLKHHADPKIPLETSCPYHNGYKVYAGDSPIGAAVKLGRIDLVKAFLDANASNIYTVTTPDRCTLLMLAALEDQAEIAELLITRGIDINARSDRGATALLFATELYHIDVLCVLLAYNADKNIPLQTSGNFHDKFTIYAGDTPLHAAIKLGYVDLAIVLLNEGAAVNARNNKGETPLHIAASKNIPTIVRKLIDNNANVEARNDQQKRPIDVAPPNAIYLDDLRILNYLNKVNQFPDDYRKYSFTLFNHKIGFGRRNIKKKTAANAIKSVRLEGANKLCLEAHKDAFKHGELKGMYRRLR